MIIDGKKIAANILDELQKQVAAFSFAPVLCDILVGDDAVSRSYLNIKKKTAERIGLGFIAINLPQSAAAEDIISEIKKLGRRPEICGIIVQLPLPAHIDQQTVLDAISPVLDVDCLNSQNINNFYSGAPDLMPPTAAAIMAMLNSLPVDLKNLNVVVVGKGLLVGKPVARLLNLRGIKYQIADRSTNNFSEVLRHADVIISGAGAPGLITGDMVKPGAIVIDAGTAESGAGISGDVDFASVSPKAAFISPVPGGVGPVTVAMLLSNAVKSAREKAENAV